MRIATPSPKRRASPRHTARRGGRRRQVGGAEAAAGGRAVHHVVVHQRERLQHLEGGAGLDHRRVVVTAAGRPEAPEAERRAQPLATAHHERAQRVERRHEVGAQRRPTAPTRR